MTDRPIHLDARDIAGRMGSQAGASQQQRREPTPHEAQRFAKALQGDGSHQPSANELSQGHPPAEVTAGGPASPFDLMRQMGVPPQASATAAADQQSNATLDRLRQDLHKLVGRLMVGEGSSGRGGRLLMMDLGQEVLPGVTVSVFDDAGAWVAEFRCKEEGSFCLLARPAASMASKLADALGQDAVWRVVAEGLPSPGEWSTLVNNAHEGLPATEAFASCARPLR